MVEEAEALLEDDPDVIHATSYVGQGSVRFWLGLNPQLPNPAFAETVILSADTEARERIKARLEAAVADGALSGARVRVDRFNFGPPVGHPVQFRVVGDDPGEVRRIAEEVRDVMAENPDVRDPHLQWNEMAPAHPAGGRPGPRPGARPRAAGHRRDAADADLRPDRHRDARRHRPRGGGRPRGARGAARRRRPRRPHRRHPRRRAGAAGAGRAHRAGLRGADPLAAQPRPDDRGPRRRRGRRAGAGGDGRDPAGARSRSRTRCRPATASRPAARSRRARRATARSSPCSRSCWWRR